MIPASSLWPWEARRLKGAWKRVPGHHDDPGPGGRAGDTDDARSAQEKRSLGISVPSWNSVTAAIPPPGAARLKHAAENRRAVRKQIIGIGAGRYAGLAIVHQRRECRP